MYNNCNILWVSHRKNIVKSQLKQFNDQIKQMCIYDGYVLNNVVAEFYGKPREGDEMKLNVTNSSSMLFLLFESM